jgi:transposase
LDVHREFAQIAVWEDDVVRQAGQIATTPEAIRVFADSLLPTDEVAIEATCNTHAIVKLIASRVARVVISNPTKTRAIAEAKVKTDKIDAAILAQLLAAGYLPAVWMPDEDIQALRRQVARRAHLVRQRTRLKNQVQAILQRNLIPKPPVSDLFGIKAAAGSQIRTCRRTSTTGSRPWCASSTSTARSCGSSTPRWAGSRSSAPKSGG